MNPTPPIDLTQSTDARPASVMVKIEGKSFRCHCECNVFHHPKERPDVYECNACGEWYEGS